MENGNKYAKITITHSWYCGSVSLRPFCNPATRAFPVRGRDVSRMPSSDRHGKRFESPIFARSWMIHSALFSARIKLKPDAVCTHQESK